MNRLLKKLCDYLPLAMMVGVIVGADQATKFLVRSNLSLGESWMPWEWLAPIVRVVHWRNTGAAFGLFPDGSFVFAIVAILVSIAIVFYWPQIPKEMPWLRLALALQMGGALGNLTDRLSQRPVTDFISVWTFPVFNVADSCITVGVIVLVIATWVDERGQRRKMHADSSLGVREEVSEGESPLGERG